MSLDCVVSDRIDFYEIFQILKFLISWTFLFSSPNSVHCALCMDMTNFTLTKKIFRQVNSLANQLISRYFCQKSLTENVRNFHHTVLAIKKKNPSNQSNLSKFALKFA